MCVRVRFYQKIHSVYTIIFLSVKRSEVEKTFFTHHCDFKVYSECLWCTVLTGSFFSPKCLHPCVEVCWEKTIETVDLNGSWI